LYGGKVDNQYDSKILVSLVEMFFTDKSFKTDYPLYRSEDPTDIPFTMPEGSKYSQFLAWIEKLPNIESPAWSGLPNRV
jgi:dynein heavy chain 1